jgi:hypothetical protein
MSRRSRIRKRERLKRKYAVRPETGRAQGCNLAIPQTSADASKEEHAMNLAICSPTSFWFAPGFDQAAKSFINAHPWPSASNHCYFESVRWAELLRKNGFDAEINIGWYRPSFHAWVMVNGKIFDPTFSQFDETPSSDKYRTEFAVDCWENLVGLALSLAPAFLYFPDSIGAAVRFSWPARALETKSASGSTTENQPVLVDPSPR